ncbi:glycosyltransferase family 4 protein [Herpetosiphon gulosus]|uniref:D-inositol-3-phosphate glycosyltransferase n=1 Tax=Herpetosiphon gulosus TaxID=1973496 RepID=A0ABP9X067_9CHLR
MRRRLWFVSDSTALGGAEGYLETLLLNTDQQQFELGLLLPPRPATQSLIDRAKAHGASIATLDVVHDHGLSLQAINQAARLFRQLRPDIVHFVVPSPRRAAELVLGAALARVPRRVITFQLVTPIPRFNWLSHHLRLLNRRWQYATLHAGIAVSQGNAQLLLEQFGFPKRRLHTIYNAVDSQRWQPQPRDSATRKAWQIPTDVPLLGVVGRLSRQKGHQILFDALPTLWQAQPNLHVALIGEGDLADELRQAAQQLPKPNQVHFVGQQANMPAALAALDVFVLPSLYEGLSFALLEAMASGQAIVASSTDGTREAISAGVQGLLVEPGQSAALAQAIGRMLSDQALNQACRQAARQRIQQQFELQTMLQRTFELYSL